ncbi:hypothetical protein JCM9279_007315 [Rhodotorula babjevae]
MPTATESSPPSSPASHTFLPAHVPSWRCATCTLELALQDELVSRSFQGASGPAFLWRTLTYRLERRSINADVGAKVKKQLMSGTHLIAPLFCRGCSTEIGWKYFVAPDSSQKYKEDKCILEKGKIYKDNKWSVDDDELDDGE